MARKTVIQKGSVTDSHEGNCVVFVMRDKSPHCLGFLNENIN